MASRGTIPKNDGAFNSVAVGLNLYVRNKITANSVCSAGMVTNELYVVGGNATVQGLKVSGDATFCGDVNISGQTTVNNIFISGNATIQQDLYVSGNTTLNGNLFVSGNTSLNGDLSVGGTVTLHDDLFVSGNTTLNGDLFVKGNTTLYGNLFVSGNTTLHNLYVTNSATLDELQVLANTTLNGDLLVQGDTTLQGHLYAGSGATIDGNLKVTGNTSLCGELEVSGDTVFKGDVTIQGDLAVQGNTTLYADLFVKGDTTLSELLVSGNTTMNGDLQVNGSVSLMNGLYVSGDSTLNGDLRVLGNTTLSSDLFVKGNTTLASNLFVSGGATVHQNFRVDGNVSLGQNLVVGLNTTMDGRLKVRGDATLCSNAQVGLTLTVDGNAIVQNDLTVNGNTDLNQQLYVDGHVTLNSSLKVSGSATFCSDVLITGATLTTDDICINTGHTLYTNDIHPKTGTMVTVGGPGDSLMVDRVNTRYIDGKFGGGITIATSVNVLGDLTATGIICSTLPMSIVEANIMRSKSFSKTLTLGTAGQPKVVCIAEGNTLLVETIIGKDGVGGLGLEICATTLQVEDIIPKAPNKSVTIGVSTTLNVDGNLNVIGSVLGNQFTPRTGSGMSLGNGGDLVQVRDNMCVDGYLQSNAYRSKENNNAFLLERINGADRVTLDISNPEFKIIAARGISLCAKLGRVDVIGDIYANNFFATGGAPAVITANEVVTDTITTRTGDVLDFQNMAGTSQVEFDYTNVAGPLINATTGALRLAANGGTNEIHLEDATQTRRLEPDTNNTRNLGTSALQYANMFANTGNVRTLTGPASAGLTIDAQNGEIFLDRTGAGSITLAAVGANRNIAIIPTGPSLVVESDLCLSGTLAVDTIIGKTAAGVGSFAVTDLRTDNIRTLTGNILDIQNMAGVNTVRINTGPAAGPLISSQVAQPLRFTGNGNGLSLEDTTTTNNVQPDQTGLRDIGTSALRYNEVFGNIGDFNTRVETPQVRNNAGNLNLTASTGIFPLTRTGAGAIELNGATNRMIINNGTAGLSLVNGTVDVISDLNVRDTLFVDTVSPLAGSTTIEFTGGAFFSGKEHCLGGTLQVDRIISKNFTDMMIYQRNAGGLYALNLRVGGGSNVIAGNSTHTIDKGSNNIRCGIFMGRNGNITGGANESVIIGGANHRITGARASAILAGSSNSLSAERGIVAGGSGNIVGGQRNSCMGSEDCLVYGNRNSIIGGSIHRVGPGLMSDSVTSSLIGGGISCSINNGIRYGGILGASRSKIGTGVGGGRVDSACIVGGNLNINRSDYSVIAGGNENVVLDATGSNNSCFLGGGFDNRVDGTNNGIVCSRNSSAQGNQNGVMAARHCSVTATVTDSAIVGGLDSVIKGTGVRNSILAGQANLIKGQTSNSVILGGFNCSIANDVAVIANSGILGGRDSTIGASNSMIVGRDAMISQDDQIFINADPTRKLQNGAALNMQVPLDGLGHIALQAEGEIYVFSDINMTMHAVNNTSDRKQKEDIEPLELGLKEVLQMEPKEFYFTQENYHQLGEPKRVGFVAQDMEKINPRFAIRESNKTKKLLYKKRVAQLEDKTPLPEEKFSYTVPDEEERFTMDYISLIPVLTNAIKQQHGLITSLQDRVATLESYHI